MRKDFEQNPILNRVRSRLWQQNLDWICVVCGKRGSGKSMSSMSMCLYIDKNFNADSVVFTVKEFFQLLKSGKVKRGSAILLDEAGTFWFRRDALSRESKMMSRAFQIVRSKCMALILTLPSWSMIDSNCQAMTDCQMEAVAKDKHFVRFKVKNVKVPATKEKPKIYYKYPRLKVPGQIKPVTNMFMDIFLPPKPLIRAYQEKKNQRVEDMLTEDLRSMDAEDMKREKASQPSKKELILQSLQEGGKSLVDIAKDNNCNYGYVRQIAMEKPNVGVNEK